jgi:hypothetical protein
MNKKQSYKFAAIQWRNDHLEHCGPSCNVSLSILLEMAEAAGAEFTPVEVRQFLSTMKMEFTS